MAKKDLKAIARLLIGKTLGLTVAAKNINIDDYEDGYGLPTYLVFTVLGFDITYVFRELPNGHYKFSIIRKSGISLDCKVSIGGAIVFYLSLEDLED